MFSTSLVSKLWRGPLGDALYRSRSGLLYRVLDRALDFLLRMETRRQVDPENHGFDPAEVNCYVPSEWWAVPYILARLPIEKGDTFADFGCGKGRVLRIAAEFPFKKLVGIELMPVVAERARSNLRKFRNIEILTGDAREVPLPEGMTFVFMFNPFSIDVLIQVMERLRNFSLEKKRRLKFLYHSPVHHEILLSRGLVTDVSGDFLPSGCLEEFRFYLIGDK